jgi:hypothetical protein
MIAPYVPLLKGKAGELDGICHLSTEQKARVTPLLDVPQMALESSDTPPKSLEDYLDRKSVRIANAWKGVDQPLVIDLYDTDPSARTGSGEHPVRYLFHLLRNQGVLALPTIGLERDVAYRDAVRDIVAADQQGLCIRLLREDLSSAYNLSSRLNILLNQLGAKREQSILIFDFRKIEGNEIAEIAQLVARTVNGLPGILNWQSVVFAGSNMPQSLADDVKAGSTGGVDRAEYHLWTTLLQQGLKRRLAFGDYGVVHPELLYIDPKMVNASAAIRYTLPDRWLIVRGKSLRQNAAGFNQFYSLSETLAGRDEFMGAQFSWGDEEIQKRARRQGTTGNLTTWVAIGTNHHLALVSEQVALAY